MLSIYLTDALKTHYLWSFSRGAYLYEEQLDYFSSLEHFKSYSNISR